MEAQTIQPVSALYWLPRIEVEGLPSPSTVMVPYDHSAFVGAIEGQPYDDADSVLAEVSTAAESIGYPAFLRTDLSSAKHDGPESYCIGTADDIGRVVSFTVQDNEIKFWLFGPTPQAFMVRQWLDLDAPFSAFGGHLIAREWRLFTSADGVACAHFYWPHEAIVEPSRDDWPELLTELSLVGYPDELQDQAIVAAAACDAVELWSVDFAQDRDGAWWLIDMAPAESSWHPDHD